MKYIESKPNGDGTYDHTEVRAGYENGCKVEFNFPGWIGEDWFFVDEDERCGRAPIWNDYMIYRASVPDTYGIHESSSTLREVKGDSGPAVAEMLLDRIKELEEALSEIIEEDIRPNIIDVMTNKERKIIDIATAALNKEQK